MGGRTATEQKPLRYVPSEIEPKWMNAWLDDGVFTAEVDESRDPYTIMMPPPNVTGVLHMGHALNGAIQDTLIRWKRMQGYNALWLPGTDHAGIATQAVVEKTLRAQGISRHDLGREAFLEKVWEWKRQYGETIVEQFKSLGCSCDYDRERFTMDAGYADAVLEAFVRLYSKGYIYRDNYLINWDAGSMSAISDLEVRQVSVTDEMVEVDYHLEDGTGHLTVATVRPETIVADTAVAVHPDDDRYSHLIGRNVRVPLTDRVVPVIADDHVDREFGTGALKITPGHDPNDFEIGRAHGLPELTAIGFDRTMTEIAGEFAGMHADEARKKMVVALEELGLVRSREPYTHMVPHSDRTGERIEPLISLQWFCDMSKLAEPAIDAAQNGEVRFIPEGSRNIFMTWMQSLKPWCLSRQLWWGHQLPVWYCARNDQHVHVSLTGPASGDACPDCGCTEWRRDEDVLDTWFSSGLWDSATLGWPNKTDDLAHFHPTSVLCTAREIINLWVARMMMFSYEFLGEKPFSDVYIHSVVQAPDGRRMSKSLGTGIDPVEIIGKYGADATRYGLLDMSSTQDVRFNEGKIREGRDLANKLWNASRLLAGFGSEEVLKMNPDDYGVSLSDDDMLEDFWILERLASAIETVNEHLEGYSFALATKAVYSFVWNELCDWYLESVKPRLRSEDAMIRSRATEVFAYCLYATIRLVHPMMPHVSEEVAEQLWPGKNRMIALSAWPEVAGLSGTEAESSEKKCAVFTSVMGAVTRIRSIRQAAGCVPSEPVKASVDAISDQDWQQAAELAACLVNLELGEYSGDCFSVPLGEYSMQLFGLDTALVKSQLEGEIKEARSELKRAEGKLSNDSFVSRAPDELVAAEREKIDRYSARIKQVDAILAQLK